MAERQEKLKKAFVYFETVFSWFFFRVSWLEFCFQFVYARTRASRLAWREKHSLKNVTN